MKYAFSIFYGIKQTSVEGYNSSQNIVAYNRSKDICLNKFVFYFFLCCEHKGNNTENIDFLNVYVSFEIIPSRKA